MTKPIVCQESASYRHGYEQGLNGREFRCPCSGNPLAEMDHAWGFAHGKNVAAGISRPLPA